MRIKNLRVQSFFELNDFEFSFLDQGDIVVISQPNDEKSFISVIGFLDIIDSLFFDDSCAKVKNCMSKNTSIECTLEQKGIEYTFGVKGTASEQVKDGYVRMENKVQWYCVFLEKAIPSDDGCWLMAQLSVGAQGYFYPFKLREYMWFNKDTEVLSPTCFTYCEWFDELKRRARLVNIETDLGEKLQEIIDNSRGIKLNERVSVCLNDKNKYVLCVCGEEVKNQEDLGLVNFCGWLNNINILKKIYEFVGVECDYPIFIESGFESLGQYKSVLIEKLKETGSQVFIISKSNAETAYSITVKPNKSSFNAH